MPSFSNNLFNTGTVSDQANQASSPSPIHVLNTHRYIPPTSPAYTTDSQATPYSLTSISLHLKPLSSSLSNSFPLLPGSILLVITDPQQCQPLDWIPIQLIPNNSKLHPHSYISITISHITEAKTFQSCSVVLKQTYANQQST